MPVAEVNSFAFGFEIKASNLSSIFSQRAYPDFSNFWQLSLLIVALIGIWIASLYYLLFPEVFFIRVYLWFFCLFICLGSI
jgi:hypothetical protein